MVITGVTSTALAMVLSKWYWGYVFTPPSLDIRIRNATAVKAYSRARQSSPGTLTFEDAYSGPPGTPREQDPSLLAEPYYIRRFAPLIALENSGSLHGPVPQVGPTRLSGVLTLVRETGKAVSDSWGYDHLNSPRLSGEIFELVGPNGEPLLLVGIQGGEVSNDHLPAYEFLFDDSEPEPKLLSTRQWYFDVAGMEGAEFPRIALPLCIVGWTIVTPISIVFVAAPRLSWRARVRRGACPACGYDLTGDFPRGCPECGWGKVAPSIPAMH